MNKNIFLSVALSIGLMVPAGLESSSWGDSAWQGLASMYSYMPNMSEYMPSTPEWVTSLMNILSEHQKLLLFTTLAGVLGYKIYPYYTSMQEAKKDQETLEAARQIYSFDDNGTDFTLKTNATNIVKFLRVAQKKLAGMLIGGDTKQESVSPERLFKVFVYPVLENISKDKLSQLTMNQEDVNFWNGKIEDIKDYNKNGNVLLGEDNNHYLNIFKTHLENFIKNNNSPTAQEILGSLNKALSKGG